LLRVEVAINLEHPHRHGTAVSRSRSS
jgi:hypothetical protein